MAPPTVLRPPKRLWKCDVACAACGLKRTDVTDNGGDSCDEGPFVEVWVPAGGRPVHVRCQECLETLMSSSAGESVYVAEMVFV